MTVKCEKCGNDIQMGSMFAAKREDGKWSSYHDHCAPPEMKRQLLTPARAWVVNL